MIVKYGGETYHGRSVDGSDWDVHATEFLRAIRGENAAVTIDCPDPTPVYDHVKHIHPEQRLRLTAALAAAARSRGLTAPEDEIRRSAEAELAELPSLDVDDSALRKAVADAGNRKQALRERVATLQGRVQARRNAGLDAEEAEANLREEVTRLSEVETEQIAARQRFERARERARSDRDRQTQRLRLEDRIENLARTARRRLVVDIYPVFADAVEFVPGPGTPGDEPEKFSGPMETAAFAVARVADLRAPVVIESDRFDTADAAAKCLGALVIRL